jgi:hypothetical protein
MHLFTPHDMFIIDLNLMPTDLRDPGTMVSQPTYHQAE